MSKTKQHFTLEKDVAGAFCISYSYYQNQIWFVLWQSYIKEPPLGIKYAIVVIEAYIQNENILS